MYHQDPKQFFERSADYGPIGAAIVSLSNLEYSHDRFILAVRSKLPEVALRLSPKFPRHFQDKTDFAVEAVWQIPKLRKIPIFDDGFLNLIWLQYQLDELYNIRPALVHGSIFYSESKEGWRIWRFDRFVVSRKNVLEEKSVEIGAGFLANVYKTANTLKFYFHRLALALDEKFDWNSSYKTQLKIRKNRLARNELIEMGICAPDPWLSSLLENNDE